MQSTSASDGTYSLTVTFEIGTDLDYRAGAGAEPRASRTRRRCPRRCSRRASRVQKKSTAILQIVDPDLPDGKYDSLFMSNYATINLVNVLARLPGVGNVKVFGAGKYSMRVWMDPEKLCSSRSDAAGRDQRHPSAEPACGGRADRHAAGAARPQFQYTVDVAGPADRSGAVRRHHRQDRTAHGGRVTRRARRRRGSSSARRPMRRFQARWQAGGRHRRSSSRRTPTRCRSANAVAAKMEALARALPARAGLRDPVRHHEFRHGLDQRGLQDAVSRPAFWC